MADNNAEKESSGAEKMFDDFALALVGFTDDVLFGQVAKGKSMDYVTVGSTGVQVLPLCFGTMSFGSEADKHVSAQMFHRIRELGINFFDTADVYAQGASEQILGKLIADCRDEVVIASKIFYPTGQDVNT